MSWAAVIGGVVAAGSAYASSSSAKSASGTQINASKDAISAQQQADAWQQARLAPFLDVGTQGSGALATLLGLQNPSAPGGTNYHETTADVNSAAFKALTDPIYAKFGVANAADRAASGVGSPDLNTHNADLAAGDLWNSQAPKQSASNTPGFGSLVAPPTMADVEADPAYANGLQFGLDTGVKGINAGALANGTYDSGATLKALTAFGNDYGTTKTQGALTNLYNNRNQIYGFLSGEQNTGLTAAGGANAVTANTASNVGNLTTGAANASAAGTVAGANAFSGVGSTFSNINASQNQNSILQQILAQGVNNQPVYSNGSTTAATAGIIPGGT